MSIGTWNQQGDYYISEKYGQDTVNSGTPETPFASLGYTRDQLPTGTIQLKKLILKSGQYSESFTTPLNIVTEVIGDGIVVLNGGTIAELQPSHGAYGHRIVNIQLRDFAKIIRLEIENGTVLNCPDLMLQGSYLSSFTNCSIRLNSSSTSSITRYHHNIINSTFLGCTIFKFYLTANFRNCFFDDTTTIDYSASQLDSEGFVFSNCVFQTNEDDSISTLIEGIPARQYFQSHKPYFQNCYFIEDPLFNGISTINPSLHDLSLQSNPRSPLYLGRGIFAGSHRFATPIKATNRSFDATLNTGDTELDVVLNNITVETDGTVSHTDPNLSGSIRSSGHPGNRLAFSKVITVNNPITFVSTFHFPDEIIDLDTSDDRPSYRVRIIDPNTGNWLPSATNWYDMQVNSPWQVDSQGRGNGDPGFDISTSKYLICKEYQINLIVNPINS